MLLIKLLTLTWHPSDVRRVLTLQPIQRFLMTFGRSMLTCPMRRYEAINRDGLASMSAAADAKHATATARKKLTWDSSLMSGSSVKCVMENVSTAKPLRLNIKGKIFLKSSKWISVLRLHISLIFQELPEDYDCSTMSVWITSNSGNRHPRSPAARRNALNSQRNSLNGVLARLFTSSMNPQQDCILTT